MRQARVNVLLFKRFFAAIFAAAVFSVFLFPSQAAAFNTGVGVGVYIPGSDMSNTYDPGVDVYAYMSFNMVPTLLDFRIQADWYNAKGKGSILSKNDTDLKFSAVGGEALVVLAPTIIPVLKPYVGAGWGVYNGTIEVGGESESKWGNGLVAVAGVGVEVVIVRIGIDGKYFINTISGDDYGGYGVGLSASIVF